MKGLYDKYSLNCCMMAHFKVRHSNFNECPFGFCVMPYWHRPLDITYHHLVPAVTLLPNLFQMHQSPCQRAFPSQQIPTLAPYCTSSLASHMLPRQLGLTWQDGSSVYCSHNLLVCLMAWQCEQSSWWIAGSSLWANELPDACYCGRGPISMIFLILSWPSNMPLVEISWPK